MKLSESGVRKLFTREGKRNTAYKDTKGVWTIGLGHTGPEVVAGLVWSDDEVMAAFAIDVAWAEEAVDSVDTILSQNQFDALVSFVYNIGASAFKKSTMRKLLEKGEYEKAAEEFNKWVIPPEIKGRRMSEKVQFLS